MYNALAVSMAQRMAKLFLEQGHAAYHLRKGLSPDGSFRGTPFPVHCVRREGRREYDDEERDPVA